jgi:8-oxo-dGTP diphosphatase
MLSAYEKHYKYCPTCKATLKRKRHDGQRLLSCPECDFVFWNNPKPVVSIVLLHESKVLMLARAHEPFSGFWCLPGGFINLEETPEQAIIREVKEETGADAMVGGLVGVYRVDTDPRGVIIDIIYYGKMSGDIVLSPEHKEYQLCALDSLPRNIAYKHRSAIERIGKMLNASRP